MNIEILYNHISELLHTNVRIMNQDGIIIETYQAKRTLLDTFVENDSVTLNFYHTELFPVIITINNLVTYVSVPVYSENQYIVLGPTSLCADCKNKLNFPSLIIPHELVSNLYAVNSSQLIKTSVFLYNLFADTTIDSLNCFSANCLGSQFKEVPLREVTKSIFNHEESGKGHNSYDAEKREMLCIERGNLTQLYECWKKDDIASQIGTLSSNHMRNAKYLCIINMALTARAAIRGGVPSELAHSLSDAYGQQIDSLEEKDLIHLEEIIRNIQITFTQLVAQQNGDDANGLSASSPIVTRVKDYIFSNLHGKITLNDVARALNSHPNYLNRIFKEAENITIHDYILREKIKLTCNMLTYSDYSYIDIANYLGFSSQSHLGSIFKKHTGMTLKKYKDTYHKFK